MLSDDSLENIKIRNDYAQYLRIMLRAGVLHGIFSNSPPTTLMPFPEAIVRYLFEKHDNVRYNEKKKIFSSSTVLAVGCGLWVVMAKH